MIAWPRVLLPLVCALICSIVVTATNATASDEDDEEELRPGLVATYSSAGGRSTCQRVDPQIAFRWTDESPDRRLPAGSFTAKWTGKLRVQTPGIYRFHVHVQGRLQIDLRGSKLLEATAAEPKWISSKDVDLPFGDHDVAIQMVSERASVAKSEQPQLALFWTGPNFQLEPISERQWFHDPAMSPVDRFERGEELVHALRCEACHRLPGSNPQARPAILAAPSLSSVRSNLSAQWVVDRLSAPGEDPDRRMPHFGLARDEAIAIASYLWNLHPADKQKVAVEPKATIEEGEQLVVSVGCLACHRLGDLGTTTLFGGGDLSKIGNKRPTDFFTAWLTDPHKVNPQNRMPTFELTKRERSSISLFLNDQRSQVDSSFGDLPSDNKTLSQGKILFETHRCASCHGDPAKSTPQDSAKSSTSNQVVSDLSPRSKWDESCLDRSNANRKRPGYQLGDDDRNAVREFITGLTPGNGHGTQTAQRVLREANCLGCHSRGLSIGIAKQLLKVAEKYPNLAPQVPAMTPPSLNSIGDKLTDQALKDVVAGSAPPLRSWLKVRMPKFRLAERSAAQLVNHFVTADRIPDGRPEQRPTIELSVTGNALELAAARLVTPDGFGCTSCHQVGKVIPTKAPLNALGPDLSQPGKRIRHEWFDRWLRNPARIVPRMEMPSVQIPVKGVLDGNLEQQLVALWEVLNRPDFQPPAPNPVRILRRTGEVNPTGELSEPAVFVTDVVKAGADTFVKPLLIGLPNRHNAMFDLATNRLAGWWIGDVARERTEGKTWFWEAGGKDLLQSGLSSSEFVIARDGKFVEPLPRGQYVTEFDSLIHERDGITAEYLLAFPGNESERVTISVSQTVLPLRPLPLDAGVAANRDATAITGFSRRFSLRRSGPPSTSNDTLTLLCRLVGTERIKTGKVSSDRRRVIFPDDHLTIEVRTPDAMMDQRGAIAIPVREGAEVASLELHYTTDLPIYTAPAFPAQGVLPDQSPLDVAPGFLAERVAVPEDVMPVALAADQRGRLAVASLKGDVWIVDDTNSDGRPDKPRLVCDGLAAPYGIQFDGEDLLALNKYALLRLSSDGRGLPIVKRAASGWGHTIDYHDWAVGLVRDRDDNLYMALPCQQDQRSLEGAKWRGIVAKLVPNAPPSSEGVTYSVEPISRGHRFPMGIAMNLKGDLFVTDNQGNYNPFNELNHVRPGAHFGFINAIEKTSDARPPLTPPSINIPHPWTRSVNGICFLESPAGPKDADHPFGPFTGHLVGCEYDTRRLLRMSIQQVGDTLQGAIYPLSWDVPKEGQGLLGPINCAVSPNGEMYIASIRDSGWGAGNNSGEVVRMTLQADRLPVGIAEMRIVSDGFELFMTRSVNRQRATDVSRYSLSSYTRESTPAYGGPDIGRQVEKIKGVQLSEDGLTIRLQLGSFRTAHVYELHVQSLANDDELFFPSEAHYTANAIP